VIPQPNCEILWVPKTEGDGSMGAGADASGAERWVEAFDLSELAVGEARVASLERRQVLVVRTGENEVYAVDSLCPYGGDALGQGRVVGATITCIEHNFRFDLKSGKCLRGEEDIAVIPVRIQDGKVQLGSSEMNPDAELERRAKSLKDALVNGRIGQAAREIVRMLAAEVDPNRVVLEIAAFDAAHNEAGVSHALSLSADVLRIAPRYLGGDAALPLVHAADLAIDASKHRSPRKVPASQDPGRDPEGVGGRLVTMLETDDAEGADGLMRGALWRKWTREQIEPWFFELNSAHFFGAGHGLVYTIKAFEVLEAVGFEHARRILPGLTYALGMMAREDTLPDAEWQWFRQRFAQLEPRLAELWSRAGQRVLSDDERRAVTRAILDGSREEAWHAVIGAWASGGRVECVIDALSRAAAERVWRFDTAIDRDPTVTDGWLNVTRPFAYAHALRAAALRHRKSSLLRMILFGVRLVNHLKDLDMPADRWTAVDAKGRSSFIDRDRFLNDMIEMLRERSPIEAQRAGLAYVNMGGSIDTLRATLYDFVLSGHYSRPRFAALGIEMTVATCDEALALPEGERTWPLRALLRMLASPLRENGLECIVHQARRLIEQGQPPRSRS
jgi:nitrite reductase/ring-hydroxylating ferredoxin subunit